MNEYEKNVYKNIFEYPTKKIVELELENENKSKQLEAYENMRKELIKEFNFYETTEWGIRGYEILEKFRNILNKVGGSDEQ